MNSFLDNDFYNFTMAQFIWKYHPNIKVKYKFTNRSKTKLLEKGRDSLLAPDFLADIAPRPTIEDIRYLESLNIFDKEFLYDLMLIEQPKIEIFERDFFGDLCDEINITYEGNWWESIFLETPILARLAELNYSILFDEYMLGVFDKNTRLSNKIDFLRANPQINFVEFGTRRRATKEWQHHIVGKLAKERPYQLQGTSNVALAQEFGLRPEGTMGHQLFMVLAAYYGHDPYKAQNRIQINWAKMYENKGAMTILTDTFGTDFFLDSNTDIDLDRWGGFRQDSGDPVVWGKKLLKRFKSAGIDPRSKMLVFSDGLTPQKMLDIWGQFGTITNVAFGWGTNLTNDVGGLPLSIIIKPHSTRYEDISNDCVKLSDNLDKCVGSSNIVNLYKEKCGYTSTFSEAPIY